MVVSPLRSAPFASSAPGLIGPTSILEWPTAAAGTRARRAPPTFAHVRVEIDLSHEIVREAGVPVLRQIEALLKEREVVEVSDLLRLTAGLLHALSAEGFSRVDHWEATPGGWLPLPEPSHDRRQEPVGHLLRALASEEWRRLAEARAFAIRLSGPARIRADAVVRRVHRERSHTLSIDLWGRFSKTVVHDLIGAVRERLPVNRSQVVSFAYAPREGGT